MKSHIISGEDKLDKWFEKQLKKAIKYGGDGAQYEFLQFTPDDDQCMIINTEDKCKSQDLIEYIECGIEFGQNSQRFELNVYIFVHECVVFYIIAKNNTDLKSFVKKSIANWMEACEPLPPPELTPTEKMKQLLLEIRDSHIGDKKGQNKVEASWCKRIDELT